MKHLQHIDEVSRIDFGKIIDNIPQHVAIFKIIKDSSYCKGRIGEEIFFTAKENSFIEGFSKKATDLRYYKTFVAYTKYGEGIQIVPSQIRFIEYRDIKIISEEIEMNKQTRKYNL